MKNDRECSLQIAQFEPYPNDYSNLLQAKRVSSKSKILNLTPIFNENLIKDGVHLHFAKIPVKNKHQIVALKTNSMATNIIQEILQINLHIGRENTS